MSNSSTPSILSESSSTTPEIVAPETVTPKATSNVITPLIEQLTSGSFKQQLSAITALQSLGEPGLGALIDFVQSQVPLPLSAPSAAAVGKVHQILVQQADQFSPAQALLENELSQGPFAVQPDWSVDYQELQQLLARQDYEAADRLTMQKLCELAGPDALARKWVYFTEADRMPIADLLALDQLWQAYSENRFGFSRQREIWLGVNQNWDRLWEKLAWKSGNIWTRYPGEFTWSLTAPAGHLPLSNQLRGVRMIAALFDHPAWKDTAAE
ncbi:MAG: GUN4 N-terminal ARM-like repeat domain-containing protein [Cyanobacteria bacterium J06632_22]